MKYRIHLFLLCASLLGRTGLAAADSPAAPGDTRYAIDIPAQDLGDALQAFALASHHKLLYSSDLVAGKTSTAIKGQFTTEEGVRRILTNTSLQYEVTTTGLVMIRAASDATLPSDVSQHSATGQTTKEGKIGSSDGVLVTQATPGQTSSDVLIEKQEKDVAKKKSVLLEEVIVTGTNIRGAAPVGAPITTLDSTDIAQSGYTTTQQLIQSLPQNFRGGSAGASADAAFSGGVNQSYNQSFGSGVNLRGLGSTATLVLIDGHRVASSGSGYFTDISTIPVSAIDHIDVLTDGASPIYGSDAIAGVINIVLKRESQGVDVGVRFGATTDSGYSSNGANVQLGTQWDHGGVTFGADFSRQSFLDSSERSFTSSIPSPSSIFPSFTQSAFSAAAHQELGDRVELYADAQYTSKTVTDFSSVYVSTFRAVPKVNRWSGSLGGSYQITDSWILRYGAAGGTETADSTTDYLSGGITTFFGRTKFTSRLFDQNISASGNVLTLPAGPAKLAVGAAYRTEGYNEDDYVMAGTFHFNVDRHIAAGYAELNIPIVGTLNAVPGVRQLTLSAALRRDHYSDFGDTTNPKFGISWFPTDSLEIRGAYSTSFRAPAVGNELLYSSRGTIGVTVYAFPDPTQTTQVPVVVLNGGEPDLKPETAKNLTLGLEFKPPLVPGLQVSLNYYDIDYSKQLATPPFSFTALSDPALASVITKYPNPAALQSIVTSAVQGGAVYSDFTFGVFGPDPLTSAMYLYNQRIQNLSKTKTSGFDIGVLYPLVVGASRLVSRLDATYIDRFSSELTPGSPQVSLVNSVGYPARFRLRAQEVWTHSDFKVSLAGNYVGGYPDTSSAAPRDVGSFTTFDLVARYAFANTSPRALHGIVAQFSAINLFDRLPPYVAAGTPNFPGSHYDPGNANPVGRFLTLQVSKAF